MGNKPSVNQELNTEKTTIFQSQEGVVYRIPALFYHAEEKVFLAFAEKRRAKDDHTSEALAMKTGTVNNDQTTNELIVTWSDLKLVKEAHLEGHRPMNPCPVYDKTNKKLFLFFVCVKGIVSECWQRFWGCNKTRLCYITSTDAGKTWSQVTDLTDALAEVKQWATFAVGPGHGIQAQSDRLIVPVYGYVSCSNSFCWIMCYCAVSRALCLYSDDKGVTWQFGNLLEKESGECEMAEICDDKGNRSIYCNARSAEGHRVEAVSADNGEDFGILPNGALVETGSGCQGSVVSFPIQNEGIKRKAEQSQDPRWLLFSHPNDKGERKDLGVYLNKSPHDPKNWSSPWIINKGPSGYSDLVYIGDGMFACLMERGDNSEIEQIAFSIFSYNEVKKGTEE
ncbi:sialidase-3-like [Pelmatolapia mariae]|uniref:sialidase-3-like n=1 Tax=Pelmatolapia mariae TaxID=158779 RepID=UPI002FE4FE3C